MNAMTRLPGEQHPLGYHGVESQHSTSSCTRIMVSFWTVAALLSNSRTGANSETLRVTRRSHAGSVDIDPKVFATRTKSETNVSLCYYVFMRTTIDLPDDLFRTAKAVSSLKGITLKTLITRAIEHEIESATVRLHSRRIEFPVVPSRQQADSYKFQLVYSDYKLKLVG